jgi:hypothetical protein
MESNLAAALAGAVLALACSCGGGSGDDDGATWDRVECD